MERLLSILNRRSVFYFLLLLAIVLRVKHIVYFPSIESDYGTQIEAAKNFTEGHGFSNASVDSTNLANIRYTTLTSWPLGFPMMLVPIYYLVHSWPATSIIWHCLGMLVMLFFILRIFQLLRVSDSIAALFLLFFAFAPSPFYYMFATDQLTAAVFMACVWLALRATLRNEYPLWLFILIALLGAVNCFIRFAYIPNALIFPCYFILIGWLRSNRKVLLSGVLTAVVSFACVFLFFSVFTIDSGRTGFLDNLLSLHLFYDHLKWFDSFPIKAFFYASPLEYRLPPAKVQLIKMVRIGIHLSSVFVLFLFTWHFLLRRKVQSFYNSVDSHKKVLFDYLLLTLITVLAVCGFMTIESLATPPEADSFGPAWMPKMWTFVYATKYFVLLMVLIQVAFFTMLSQLLADKQKGPLRASALVFLAAAFLYAGAFWAFTQYQVHSSKGNGGASVWKSRPDDHVINSSLSALAQGPEKVVFCSFKMSQSGPLYMYSGAAIYRDYKGLLHSSLPHSAPLILVVQVPEDAQMSTEEKDFLQKHKAIKMIPLRASALYRIDLL